MTKPDLTEWLRAQVMRRSFGFDVLACPRCGERLELIALIEDPKVIRRILSHLGLPTETPAARPSRPPPADRTAPGDMRSPVPAVEHTEPWYDDDGELTASMTRGVVARE